MFRTCFYLRHTILKDFLNFSLVTYPSWLSSSDLKICIGWFTFNLLSAFCKNYELKGINAKINGINIPLTTKATCLLTPLNFLLSQLCIFLLTHDSYNAIMVCTDNTHRQWRNYNWRNCNRSSMGQNDNYSNNYLN